MIYKKFVRTEKLCNKISIMLSQDVEAMKYIIRAGATCPTAVTNSYFESSENSPRKGSGKQIILFPNRNTCLRPAFGATRDEGAVGPIRALSPYLDAVDYNRRRRQPAHFKANRRTAPPDQPKVSSKGPTAETIISMTAAGKKPPVPETDQIEKHKKSLSEISVATAEAAASRHVRVDNHAMNDKDKTLDSIPCESGNIRLLSDVIPGYRQTWGVAFSPDPFPPFVYPPGPGGAKYPQNYPPGDIHSK